MTNFDKLKQVIQAANPEIMELKFGCAFEDGSIFIEKYSPYALNTVVTIFKNGRVETYETSGIEPNHSKILGRPIRLADVLLACKEKGKAMNEQEKAMVKYPFFYNTMQSITHAEINGKEFWNLRNDNLDAQSDETKQFLIDLLIQ